MQFTQELVHHQYVIKSFDQQSIMIGNSTYHHPVIILPNNSITIWQPQDNCHLTDATLTLFKNFQPEVIIIGCGKQSMPTSQQNILTLLEIGIGVEYMTSTAACHTYNILLSEERKVAAAILIGPPGNSN